MSGRSLILRGTQTFELLNLADESLRSLSLHEDGVYRHNPLLLPRIAGLTGLTRLELSQREGDAVDSIQMLRGLQLQELVLIECSGIEQRLFIPGALTTLRRLHIEESDFISEESMMEILPENTRQELRAAGDSILQLPHLYQVSGMCTLYQMSMQEGLRSWTEALFPEGLMVSYKSSHSCAIHQMKVWTKPQS